jgi:hypothetical protein
MMDLGQGLLIKRSQIHISPGVASIVPSHPVGSHNSYQAYANSVLGAQTAAGGGAAAGNVFQNPCRNN